MEHTSNLDDCVKRIKIAREKKEVLSLAYLVWKFRGNFIDV